MRRAGPSRAGRRAFTLVELMGSLVIVGAVAGVCAPVIMAVSEAFTRASEQREALERASFAIERVVRALRDAPGAPGGGAGIVAASGTGVTLLDGAVIELVGTTLRMSASGGAQPSPLCQDVSALSLVYLGADGATDTRTSPGATRRVEVTLTVNGAALRGAVFLRAAGGATP